MLPCPHCGKSIEVATPKKVPWWKYDPGGPTVGLGCGTLLIIAIIVGTFTQGRDDSETINRLREDIQTLTKKIEGVETSLQKLSIAQGAPDEKNQ